jgi:hypothetical protein
VNIDWPPFLLGVGAAINVCGYIYWNTVSRIRREDVEWRIEQRDRIDELQERSERLYEQNRKDLGLPPTVRS